MVHVGKHDIEDAVFVDAAVVVLVPHVQGETGHLKRAVSLRCRLHHRLDQRAPTEIHANLFSCIRLGQAGKQLPEPFEPDGLDRNGDGGDLAGIGGARNERDGGDEK